jgi:hypothetical protein
MKIDDKLFNCKRAVYWLQVSTVNGKMNTLRLGILLGFFYSL